jgi:putative acetyltransferase
VPLEIRPAKPADLPAVRALHHDSIRQVCSAVYEPAAIDEWVDLLTPERYEVMLSERAFVVALLDGEFVGFGVISPDKCLVNALYVAPDALGRGVGSALLRALEDVGRAAGVDTLRLESTLNAATFYESRGWARGAETVSRFHSGLELSSVEMTRALGR